MRNLPLVNWIESELRSIGMELPDGGCESSRSDKEVVLSMLLQSALLFVGSLTHNAEIVHSEEKQVQPTHERKLKMLVPLHVFNVRAPPLLP